MAKKAKLKGGRGKTGTRQAHCGIDMCSAVKISWHKIGGSETKPGSRLEYKVLTVLRRKRLTGVNRFQLRSRVSSLIVGLDSHLRLRFPRGREPGGDFAGTLLLAWRPPRPVSMFFSMHGLLVRCAGSNQLPIQDNAVTVNGEWFPPTPLSLLLSPITSRFHRKSERYP